MVLDNSVNCGQAKARAVLFCGKEGVKDSIQLFLRNSGAIVRDGDFQPASLPLLLPMAFSAR